MLSEVSKTSIRIILALILGLAVVGFWSIPVQAQPPVDLELGGEGATSWNIENIKPGDSGTKTVELHNAGIRHGAVTIWISDIEEVDYGGDGAALDDYLLFNLSGERLSTSITLPATIRELPQSATDTNHIKISRLYAGETVTLVWEWEFPETGGPQNNAQGDSLSFTINYLLEELPYGGGESGGALSYQQLKIDILGKITLAKVSSSGILLDSCVATDPDNKHSLELERGTKVTCANGKVPTRIEMRLYEGSLSPPSGKETIGPTYKLTGYISDSVSCSLIFDKPVELTLSYEPEWLPQNTVSIVIASYEAEHGWTELKPVDNGVAQVNKITVLISHTSIFAILAEIAPTPPPALAEFELSELAINPAQVETGEPVTISAIVQNTGELEGSYTLTLRINGVIEQSQEITLAAGESRQVSFTVIKHTPGTYAIAVDGLSGEFTVLAPASSPTEGHLQWWVMLPIASGIAPLLYFLAIRRRHHP